MVNTITVDFISTADVPLPSLILVMTLVTWCFLLCGQIALNVQLKELPLSMNKLYFLPFVPEVII